MSDPHGPRETPTVGGVQPGGGAAPGPEVRTRNPIHLFTQRAASGGPQAVAPAAASGVASDPAPAAQTGVRSGRGSRIRRAVVGATAGLGAAGLLIGIAGPLPVIAADAAPAAVAPRQALAGTGGADALQMVDVVAPVPVAPEFRPSSPSLAGIDESAVRYPFDGDVPLTDPFGYRTAPVEQFHDAQDFAAPDGTPIRIIASGVVLEAGFATDGCGFGLKVQHNIAGSDVTSRYCHMRNNSSSWQVGDRVKIGDEAGLVGATGMAFGAHLHLALRRDDQPIDPMPFLRKHIGKAEPR